MWGIYALGSLGLLVLGKVVTCTDVQPPFTYQTQRDGCNLPFTMNKKDRDYCALPTLKMNPNIPFFGSYLRMHQRPIWMDRKKLTEIAEMW